MIETLLQRLDLPVDPLERMTRIVRAFRMIPYENLTKIIRHDGRPGEALETADEIVTGYLERGSGGTCFSIVNTLQRTLSAAGIESNVVLADRHYGSDTHCALVAPLDGREWLLDPGYLIFEPIEIPGGKSPAPGGVMEWSIVGDRIEAATTFPNGFRKLRYSLKMKPVSQHDFTDAWKRSFEFEMMNYPVVTKLLEDGSHVYLRGSHLMVDGKTRHALSSTDIPTVVESWGIHPSLARRALEILGRS